MEVVWDALSVTFVLGAGVAAFLACAALYAAAVVAVDIVMVKWFGRDPKAWAKRDARWDGVGALLSLTWAVSVMVSVAIRGYRSGWLF